MTYPLVQFWQKFTPQIAPFAHPEDIPFLKQEKCWPEENDPKDFRKYIASHRFGKPDGSEFHLSLFPVPYIGDLHKAEIVILLLNPGFSHSDYWAETEMSSFRTRLERNLQQDFNGVDFPFVYLDPESCWHPGFIWWEKKLREVITEIAKHRFDGSYLKALRDLSIRIACLELVPYHSSSFVDHALFKELPSVRATLQFVAETLVPEANTDKRRLVVMRQAKSWKIPDGTANTFPYTKGHARGASLGAKSPGGAAILGHYGIAPYT